MRCPLKICQIFILVSVATGCATQPEVSDLSEAKSNQYPMSSMRDEHNALLSLSDSLDSYFSDWEGTPYRWGGASKKGVDCSAFTQHAYQVIFQQQLPRTTLQQVKTGEKVKRKNAKQGDLVFFKTGARRYHVGVYLGDNAFMHASTSKGVITSRLDNPYWQSVLWQFRRYATTE